MAFFKRFQEKASTLGNLAAKYYDEGVTYATKELEKEEAKAIAEKAVEEKMEKLEDLDIKKSNSSMATVPTKEMKPLEELSDKQTSSDHTETLDGETDSAVREYEILLENAQKRDSEYQRMLKENELKIIELTQENLNLKQELEKKDGNHKNFENELKQLQEDMKAEELNQSNSRNSPKLYEELSSISSKLRQIKSQFEFKVK